MSCKFCATSCGAACLPLEQVRVVTFPRIFDPSMARARQARGYASVVKAFQLKGYGPELEALHRFAIERAGKKTVALALSMLSDPFICEVAQRMADLGFREREPFANPGKKVIC